MILEEGAKSNLEVLDLSGNNICKESAKTLGHLIEKLPELKTLNLSSCKLGVAGGHLLKTPQTNCKKLIHLNQYRNMLDVDGMRSLSKVLATNTSLKSIDLGFNRLKDEGQKNIVDALAQNEKSSQEVLGLRYNFLSDYSVMSIFERLHKTSKLRIAFQKRNKLTTRKLKLLKDAVMNLNANIYVDALDKLNYLREDLLNRTLYLDGIPRNYMSSLKSYFETTKKCGKVLNIRCRRGQNYPNRQKKDKDQFFMEFASEVSVNKALLIKAKARRICNTPVSIYKAGTATFFYSKATQEKSSRTNYTLHNTRGAVRGRLARGRGGRGAFRGRR